MKTNKIKMVKKVLFIFLVILTLIIFVLILSINFKKNYYKTRLTKDEIRYLKEKKNITFTGQINYAPFEYLDKDGNYNGMMIDLLRWISYEFGFNISFKPTTFLEAQNLVKDGKIDGITSLFYSEKRELVFDFSSIIFMVPASIFVYYNRYDISSDKESHFKGLNGKKIAMQKGDYAQEFLKENNVDANIVYVDDFYQAIDKIISNEVDVVIGDEQVVWYHIFSKNYVDKIKVIGDPLYVGLNCFGLHKGDKILKSILNKGIQKAKEEGILDRLTKKWIGKSYQVVEKPKINEKFLIFLIIIVLIIIIILSIFLFKTINKSKIFRETATQRLRKIIDSLPYIIYLIDENRDIAEYNVEFARFFAIPFFEKKLSLESINQFISPLLNKQFEQISFDDIDVLNNNLTIKREIEIIDINGEKRTFSIQKIPIQSKLYKQKGVLTLLKDITEEKKSEEEILRVQKLESVGLLAGKIAHDFNNILTGIIGNLSLALASFEDKEELLELIKTAKDVALQAKNLTSQLLVFSKGGAPIKELFDPLEVIKVVLNFSVKGTSFEYELKFLSDKKYYLYADKNQYFQALNNLVLNSIQASREGSKISVKLDYKELDQFNGQNIDKRFYCVVSLEDWGTGIPEKAMDKIFNPFYTTKQNSSGLGLSSIKTICKNHNGYVFFENKKEGGAIFYLLFPSTYELITLKENKNESFRQYNPYSIVLLDDDDVVINTAKKVFRFFNCDVDATKNSSELLKLFELDKKYDICILDLIVPGSEGGEGLIKILKSRYPDTIFVVSSGYFGSPVLSKHKEYGFDYMLKKPYDFEDIKSLLKNIEEQKKKFK